MHSFPWYADLFFSVLVLMPSWQFWAVVTIAIAAVVAWFKRK